MADENPILVQPTTQTVQAQPAAPSAVVLAPTQQRIVAQSPPPVVVQAAPVTITEPVTDTETVVVTTTTPSIVRAGGGLQGPAGPPGVAGPPGDVTFVYRQSVPAAVWPIAHNLGRYPSVTVVDSAGDVCVGDVDYVDANNVTLTFSAPFSGSAFLN